MAKPRQFTTLPTRIISDTRLTALEQRCLMVIALHDGMSLMRGTGAGCYARSATLAELVKTDITNFSKAVSRLIKFGYIVREAQQNDKRRFTLRVVYGDENSWRSDQLSDADSQPEIVGEKTNLTPDLFGEGTNFPPKLVGEGDSKNGGNLPNSDPQYIPLNGEIDFVRNEEINSVETARHAFCAPRVGARQNGEIVPFGSKKDGAEAAAARKVSITGQLSRTFSKLPPEAQLSRFENEFDKIGRNPNLLTSKERGLWDEWLFCLADDFAGEAVGHRAQRLYEEMGERA